jgi:hypothetical protein
MTPFWTGLWIGLLLGFFLGICAVGIPLMRRAKRRTA